MNKCFETGGGFAAMTRNLLILRSKVTFFQKFFIPASMLAGFLGLLLGSQFLNVIHFSDAMSSYAGLLVIPVFAIIGLNRFSKGGGKEGSKDELRRVSGDFFRVIVFFIQFCLPIAVALTVVKALMPSISDGFGVLLASGFIGGHGTAAAVGSTLDTLGYHLSLVLVASGFGYLINTKLVARWLPGVPSYTVAFLVAILMFLVFRNTKVYEQEPEPPHPAGGD